MRHLERLAPQRERWVISHHPCLVQGFWGEEGEYLTLRDKHDFQASHIGYCLALLHSRLRVCSAPVPYSVTQPASGWIRVLPCAYGDVFAHATSSLAS
jgi:hypothetical protein